MSILHELLAELKVIPHGGEYVVSEMSWEIAKVTYLISSDFPQRALLRNALGN